MPWRPPPPNLCVQSLSRMLFLPLLGKFWGREGRQSSLMEQGECMGKGNSGGFIKSCWKKTGRGMKQQLGCLNGGGG